MTSTTKSSESTRDNLLEAAISALESGGIGAVKVRDIAAAAGVTYASLYHFFGDRDGLVAAAQAERYKRSILIIKDSFAPELNKCRNQREFKAFCRRSLAVILGEERADKRMTRINVLGSSQTNPLLQEQIAEAQRAVNRQLADMFRSAQLKGWIRGDLNLETFFAWYSGMITSRVLIEIDSEHADSKVWDNITIEAILHALCGDG